MNSTRARLARKVLAGGGVAIGVALGLNVLFRNPEVGSYDVAKGSPTTLSPETTALLAGLTSPVKITYYVTEKKRLPTPLRSMEREVGALLRQMSRWAPHFLTIEIIHPEDRPQDVRGVGRFRLSSFQYKTILKDEYSVSTVWSGLLIEYKGVSRAIPYVTPLHLPNLEEGIETHLRHIDAHYVPSVALRSAGENHLLSTTLKTLQLGAVIPWSPGTHLPSEADAVFLSQPENLTPPEVESIERFLEDGKDVYLFVSPYRSLEDADHLFFLSMKSGLENFLLRRGITIEPKLLLGEKNGTGRPNDLILPPDLANLEGFVLTAQGPLLFPQAAPLRYDPVKGKSAGFFSHTLLISDDRSWTRPLAATGRTVFAKNELNAPVPGDRRSREVGLLVRSDKPWEGKLLIFSSGYLFDDVTARLNGPNALYLKNLLMTYAKPELLTSVRASRKTKSVVPPLSRNARLIWRGVVMGIFPLFLLAGLFVRGIDLRRGWARGPRFNAAFLGIALAGGVALSGILAQMKRWSLPSWDMTRRGDHSLSPLTLRKIQELNQDVKITFYHSHPDRLPLSLKTMGRRVQDTLLRLASANRTHVSVRFVSVPDDPSDALQSELDRIRIKPFLTRTIDQDRYVENQVYSGLVFETGDRAETIPRFTLPNIDRLEFLTVTALMRLQGKPRPTVGILVDLPRLTPGEFWELEQLNVKAMPKSENVYARLIEMLRNEGYDVRLYDSKMETPGAEDVLLYIQPWLISPAVRETIDERLHEGGNVLIAVQHYRMQTRKYPGHAFVSAYWPQPQFSRINEFLERYGVELIKEVFLDQSKSPTAAREQINWGAYRKEEMRAPDAQPFLIRAIPENFSKNSPITARLSDLLFIWGNRWRKVPGNFPATLRWDPLVSSSKDAWAVDWKGGFLSPDDLREGNYFDANQPLVVEVTGRFPLTGIPRSAQGHGRERIEQKRVPPTDGKDRTTEFFGLGKDLRLSDTEGNDGRLVLVGCSEILSNENLDTLDYDNQKFFLNTIASLAYGTDTAWIQAQGETRGEGFPFVPPAKKMLWRLVVLALLPSLLLFVHRYRHAR